jgi:hypothetical protein
MNAVRADKDGKFEASARCELEMLMKLANWQAAEYYQSLENRETFARMEKKTQVEGAIR